MFNRASIRDDMADVMTEDSGLSISNVPSKDESEGTAKLYSMSSSGSDDIAYL